MMNSSQLDLWPLEVARLPWGGRSPRALTKVQMLLFSRREPQKDDRFFVDPDQRDLFHAAIKGPRRSVGAPLLVEPMIGG